MQRRFRAIHKKPHRKIASITRRILHILCFIIVHNLIPFYFILIQYKVNLNLTSTKFIFHAVIRSTLTVTIAFPVWNDSCVNSSTIVLSSRYYFLYASCPVWVVLPTEYHFCYTSGILLLFYLNFWTICPKAAFLFFVHERTKKEHSCFYT